MAVRADDAYKLQLHITLIEEYADADYKIDPIKSEIILVNIRSKNELAHLKENSPVTLNGRQIPSKEEIVHLGVKRNCKSAHPTKED